MYKLGMVQLSQYGYGGDENEAWQEEADYTQGPREKVTACHTESQGKTRVWSGDRRQEWGESLGHSPTWDFSGKGKAEQGK